MDAAIFNQLLHRQTSAPGLSVSMGFWVHLLPHRWARWVLGAVICRQLRRLELDYFSVAVTLKGLLAELHAQQTGGNWVDDEQADRQIDKLQATERSLLAGRTQLLALAQLPSLSASTAIGQALSVVIGANAEAFEAAQALRWEMMETQADADIAAGRVHRFDSTEDAIAFLRSA